MIVYHHANQTWQLIFPPRLGVTLPGNPTNDDIARVNVAIYEQLLALDANREPWPWRPTDHAVNLPSPRQVMLADKRDWSANPTDAWLYAIIVGWESALSTVGLIHGWTPAQMGALEAAHQIYTNRENA